MAYMKILLADDHVLFRETLTTYINYKCPDWVITHASGLLDALDCLAISQDNKGFDIVLLDLRMPGMDGVNGLKEILSFIPNQVVAILSGTAEETQVKEAMALGSKAFFPKTLSGKTLIKAIDLVVSSGHRFIPTDDSGIQIMPSYYDDYNVNDDRSTINKQDLRADYINRLTKREKQVMQHLSQGLANKEIAQKLDLQPTTIKIHVGNICKKLGVDNRTQAAIMCHQYQLNSEYSKTAS